MSIIIIDTDIEKIIDSLESNLSSIDRFTNEDNKYFDSYFEFVKYFEEIATIDYHSLVISSYFTYGWMPTILKNFDTENDVKKSIDIFNKVKNNIEIDNGEYYSLIKCINNSIVGVSKLLHFINPTQYPIFDSRIKNYFKNNNSLNLDSDKKHLIWKLTYQNKDTGSLARKDIEQYKLYRYICSQIIKNDRFNKIYIEAVEKLSVRGNLTEMRVLENMFFYFGKR